ncbi:MAG: CRISPR-associated endonuclease Cas1, partial [Gammaproteobacteria bacterium]|nr:CRISPR-associated endonuclease Cas1 [Gammaproteobacteria bacterium]
MSTLYIDRKDLELRAEGQHLALYEKGERRSTVPLTLVERVVIRGQASLSTGVLTLLADEGIGLCVLTGRHSRHAATLLGKPHGDADRRIAQYRWYYESTERLRLARLLVLAKLRASLRFLERAERRRPDQRLPLHKGRETLRGLMRTLADPGGAATPLDLSRLNGLEGAGGAAHFAAYAALLPEALGFTARNRRPPRDPVNAALSLAYTLLHFDAVGAAHAAGLDPMVGFYHEPAYSRASLASDLIEPLRPKVDEWVWRLFA